MGRVLIAVAGTEFDHEALSDALHLLGDNHQFIFLTVYQGVVPAVVTDSGIGGAVVLGDDQMSDKFEKQARESGAKTLHQVLNELGVKGEVRVETGDPGERICAVAIAEDADLIVMGSHHTGALRRLLGGSIADDVAHHAPCPVLLTRHKPAAH